MTDDEKLEQPMQTVPGNREYRVPRDVLDRDSSLAVNDRARFEEAQRAVQRAARAKAAPAEYLAELRAWQGHPDRAVDVSLLAEMAEDLAAAWRDVAAAAMRELLWAQKVSGVHGSGVAGSGAAETLSAGPKRYRVLYGAYEGATGKQIWRGMHFGADRIELRINDAERSIVVMDPRWLEEIS
jgi:hypothetical protein